MQRSRKRSSNGGRGSGASPASAPMAVGRGVTSSRPHWGSTQDGIRVRHTELVGTLLTGAPYSVFKLDPVSTSSPGYDLIPSNGQLFPWLSGIAALFERYRFHSVWFDIRASQPSTAVGHAYAAVDLDCNDPVPVDARELMNNPHSVSGNVWQNLSLTVPGRDLMRDMPYRFCSVNGRTGYTEARTALSGFFVFGATNGADYTWDLSVGYDVELVNPTLESPIVVDTGPLILPATWPTGAAASASVLNLVGGQYVRNISESVPVAGDCMAQRISGVGNVPPLLSTVLGASSGLSCFDLSGANGRNLLIMHKAQASVTGVAPSSILSWGPNLVLEAFNSLGAKLGDATSTTVGFDAGVGVTGAQSISIAGTPVQYRAPVNLRWLQATWPTIRYYLLSMVGNNAGLAGAGFYLGGKQMLKEL